MEKNNNLEFLKTVCSAMQARGLVSSMADFSTRMLGRSPSYLSSMVARNRRVNDRTISDLKRKIQACIETPNLLQPNAPSDLLAIYVMMSAFEPSDDAVPASVARSMKSPSGMAGYRWWGIMKARLRPLPSKR
jgi:hypothetical protein